MKKLLLLLLIFSSISYSQAPLGMVQIEMPEVSQRKKKHQEPSEVTVQTNVRVTQIANGKAQVITSKGAKLFRIPTKAEYNPFGYEIQEGREYRVTIVFNVEDRESKHTRGQYGEVTARLLWFTVSAEQLQRDQVYCAQQFSGAAKE